MPADARSPAGPVLVCAGTDPRLAGDLAQAARELLPLGRAVALSSWSPLAGTAVGGDEALDAWDGVRHELDAQIGEHAAVAAAGAAGVLADAGWEVEARVVRDERRPWEVVLATADELDAPLVVAGLTERAGVRPGALGAEARALAHRSRRPLLMIAPGVTPRQDAPAVLAFDGSEPATEALRAATALLRPRPAVVVTVWRSLMASVPASLAGMPGGMAMSGAERLDESSRDDAVSLAAQGADLLRGAGWSACGRALETRAGVWGPIVDAGRDRDAAVLVTGTRGRSRVAAVLLGSVAEGVLRHAGRAVLLVPRPAEDP